jgi:hypothetical protein
LSVAIIDQAVLTRANEVAHNIQCLVVVVLGRVGSVLRKLGDSKGNVGMSAQHEEHERSNHHLVLCSELRVNRTVVGDWDIACRKWRRNRLGVLHATAFNDLLEVVTLVQVDFTITPGECDPNEFTGFTKVAAVPFLHDHVLDGTGQSRVRAHKECIIHVDNGNDKFITTPVDVNAGVGVDGGKIYLLQGLSKSPVPYKAGLLESIERMVKSYDHVLLTLDFEAFRLLHIDLLFELTIQVCVANIKAFYVPVLEHAECKHDAYSLETHDRQEDLVVVHAFDLREAFDNKAHLEAAVTLDVMHPAVVNVTNQLVTCGSRPDPVSLEPSLT